LLKKQGKLDDVKPLYEQSLVIFKKVYGETHPQTATSLNNLASLLQAQGLMDEAKRLFEQSLPFKCEHMEKFILKLQHL